MSRVRAASRRAAAWLLLYIFGLSITTLLVGLWGRAVSGDEEALQAGVRAAVETELVSDRMEDWLTQAVGAESSLSDTRVADRLERIGSSAVVGAAIDTLVVAMVDAAVAEPGTATTVDVGSALAPVGVAVAEELGAAGLPVSAESVTEALAGLEPIVLASERGIITGAAATARGLLTSVAVVATLAAMLSGGLSIALAGDRVAMARTLFSRVAVGTVTFAVFARIGAWALDPERGRSPIAAGGSVLLRSNTALLIVIAVAAAAATAGLGAYAVRRRRLEAAASPPVQSGGDPRSATTAGEPDRLAAAGAHAGLLRGPQPRPGRRRTRPDPHLLPQPRRRRRVGPPA
ncbi:MAG: hypothetical protein H0V96_00200 [Acidimicrobiia bacterium]|nr:hypothetical protein [Acidimicrobiia bacterium]